MASETQRKQAQARLDAIDGELRAQLSPIEIALRLRESKLCYETLHPETRASRETGGGKRRVGEKAFVTERAEKTLKSESWIRQHLRIADIPDDLLAPLSHTSIAPHWTKLYELACQQPTERLREVAHRIIEDPKVTLKEALKATVGVGAPQNPSAPMVGGRCTLLEKTWQEVTPQEIKDGEADAVISDIDWSAETMQKLAEFVAFCRRIVRPGGRAVILTGQKTVGKIEEAFCKQFSLQWMIAYTLFTPTRPPWLHRGRSGWFPVLVFGREHEGERWPYNCPDVIHETYDPQEEPDAGHMFAKSVPAFTWLVGELTSPGGLVVDPFAGSSTTGVAAIIQGRRFLGIEREPTHIATSKKRLAGAVAYIEEEEAERAELADVDSLAQQDMRVLVRPAT